LCYLSSQLWTNYRLQSADGLALPFLANWLAGDATNLIGCLLTNQLPFQTYLAVYFVWVDFCLLSQYLYYESYLVRKRQKLGISTGAGTAEIASPLTASPTATFPGSRRNGSRVVQLRYIPLASSVLPQTNGDTEPVPPTDDTNRTSWTWVVGRISAWTCTTLYLTSRMPQIWKNYTRQSVDGLSISLFVFAFLGNFFYVASVLTSSRMFGTPVQRLQYLKDSLPYLIGSGGTFVFDFTIVIQSFVYRGLRPVTSSAVGQPRRRYTAAIHSTEQDALLGHSRSQSVGWARRSPSVTRGRASLERFGKRTRPSIERSGYGSTQGAVPGQSGGA
ncbi:hypothetical protein BDV93DRAFT_430091, partial [Ceratobasidium sp. AG-I]